MLIGDKNKLRGVFVIVSASIIFILAFMFLLPKVIDVSPAWQNMYGNVQSQGIEAFPTRLALIRKGWFFISENPLVGIGIGGTRKTISIPSEVFPGYLLHNTFLTDWAEKGILGLLSNVIWVFAYLKFSRRKFFELEIGDQIWLLLFSLILFEMFFKEINSVTILMWSLFSGIYYEQYQIEHAKMPSRPKNGQV